MLCTFRNFAHPPNGLAVCLPTTMRRRQLCQQAVADGCWMHLHCSWVLSTWAAVVQLHTRTEPRRQVAALPNLFASVFHDLEQI